VPSEDKRFRNILAIDSSSEYLQLALAAEDGLEIRVMNRGLKHAEILVPSIQSILNDRGLTPRDLDGLVCGSGPGSFTGLRIGMAAAKAMSAALSIPMVSVGSLKAIAAASPLLDGLRVAVIDARKQRFYVAAWRDSVQVLQDSDLSPGEIASAIHALSTSSSGRGPREAIFLCGPHGDLLLEKWKTGDIEGMDAENLGFAPWAGAMLELGRDQLERGEFDAEDKGPEYIRVSEAELGITRKQAP
jgi:tRNA threonylcarbamoyladenosine biosynthesis protein TsaB